MNRIEYKALSVNQCWQGKRFKTPIYNQYEIDLLSILPKIKLPPEPLELHLLVGFSSSLADLDNILKPLLDIMQKKYSFNDKNIYKIIVEKTKVLTGK